MLIFKIQAYHNSLFHQDTDTVIPIKLPNMSSLKIFVILYSKKSGYYCCSSCC